MAKEATKIIRIRETSHKKLVTKTARDKVSIVDYASDAIEEKIKKKAKNANT